MSYNKPPFNNLPFSFGSTGYTAPDFSSVPFRMGLHPSYQQSAYLQAAIDVFGPSGCDDLQGYIKTFQTSNFDIPISIAPIPSQNLASFLHGWDTKNLDAYLNITPPFDLHAIMNIIEIYNLPGSIVGEWWHGSTDISAGFHRILNRNYSYLSSIIHGWAERYLPAYITAVYFKDLWASIRGSFYTDIAASIGLIPPSDIQGIIHGYDTYDLPSLLNGVYGPYDIQGYIRVHPSLDLSIIMRGVYSGYKNLNAILEGWNVKDLHASMQYIYISDLNASINDMWGKLNLGASIIPGMMLLKRVLKISLMEYKNLGALVNFSCGGSGYKNLSATFGTIFSKRDLPTFIYGWHSGLLDNLKDLGAYINTESYSVQDKYLTTYDALPITDKHIRLVTRNATYDPSLYKVWDKLNIRYGAFNYKNLTASMIGVLNSYNLRASITTVIDMNYSELPDYIKPKSHEVFINLERGEDQWRRFIELMFDRDGTAPFKYFYVDGTQKVYKIDRDRHWTIWAMGYDKAEGSFVDRVNIRKKFIFDLNKYNTVDEAIRELMERAAHPTRVELSAFIDGGVPPHIDLSATMDIKNIYRWSRNLPAQIDAIL